MHNFRGDVCTRFTNMSKPELKYNMEIMSKHNRFISLFYHTGLFKELRVALTWTWK